jgi:hypothetical protein
MSAYRDTEKDASAWKDLDGFGEDDELDDDSVSAFTRFGDRLRPGDERIDH